MAKQKVRMSDVMTAFFKHQTAASGRHKTENGEYYYCEYLLAKITKTKFIINPNKKAWPKGTFNGAYAAMLLRKYLTDRKIVKSHWRSEYPFISNKGWEYTYRSMIFDFPLVLDRKTNKIKNKIEYKYVIDKFKFARNIYNIDKIVQCIKHFDIKVPDDTMNRKKEILCGHLSKERSPFSEMTLIVLLDLKTNDTDIINIKNAIKDYIVKCTNFNCAENVRKAIDKYFKNDAGLLTELKPKYVELKFDMELNARK